MDSTFREQIAEGLEELATSRSDDPDGPSHLDRVESHDGHIPSTFERLQTQRTNRSHHRPSNDPNLPYRTLDDDADLEEYVRETILGETLNTVISRKTGKLETHKVVTFKIHDPENPKNWSRAYKWYCTMVVAFTCFVVAFNSSVVTADIQGVSKQLDVSDEVSLLTVSFFVVGFGIGPMVFAPMSEIIGRRWIYASTLLIAVIFVIPSAVAQNIGTLLTARAIDGIAFSAPMTLVGGTLADLWPTKARGVPMAAFSAAPFLGPVIGPLAGGYLSERHGWRWLYWLQLILSGAAWILITFTVPETYAPTLLSRRAARLREDTGDQTFTTEREIDDRPLGQRLRLFLLRPFQLLFGELIVFFVSVYMSVLYGLLYMFFVAVPIVYEEGKGFSAGSTGLMFIPLGVGVLMGSALSPFINIHYKRLCRKHDGKPPAEVRLLPMMLSCWFVPVGLFIFAWSSYPRLSWTGPAFGGFPVGFGFIFLYNSANNYIVDSYQHQAASALAAKTFLRSIWGAAVVLFTTQMYAKLGYQWAGSLLAFIALACCAIPYVFWFYGAAIRKKSKYAYGGDDEEEAGEKGMP